MTLLLQPTMTRAIRRQGAPKVINFPTIVLDLELRGAWDRGVAQEIIQLGRDRSWNMILTGFSVQLIELASTWQPAVVIGSFDPQIPRPPALKNTLLISLGKDASAAGIPSVCPDDRQVGRLAAEHLLQTGLKTTSVFAYDESRFGQERSAGFKQAIAAAGAVCLPGGEFSHDPASSNFCSHASIVSWLESLPVPCGVFALCDNWAAPIATYCRHLGLRIPDDIALLGVENDPLVCELSSPPLSSVSISWGEMARAIVRIIDDHLDGRPVEPKCIRISPVDVVSRRSTDVLSIADSQVAEAVAWIRRNAHEPISVEDVLRAVPTYRQRLERQFRSGLGRTIMEEVRRAHVEIAKTLLTTTHLSMPEIALRSGFSNATLLGVNFRKELGMTPSEYRRLSGSTKPPNDPF